MEQEELELVLEAILFASGDPVPVERMSQIVGQRPKAVSQACQSLADRYSYERRGIRLLQLEDCWQMCSAPEHAELVRRVLEHRRPPRLSQPALEVLAVIAYFQPVTRAYIEQIRGVDSSYTVGLLLERELICEAGRLALPGRPMQFCTTPNFLRTFGLSSLEDLPDLPATTQENAQVATELERAIERLQEAEQAVQQEEGA
ncbi:MAG TPA: SMC-Scp complex subunit ScpB [Clostridiales bacterium]|nr:SMC-Scp complex subunit ScpB [Clostridiales bacterium]